MYESFLCVTGVIFEVFGASHSIFMYVCLIPLLKKISKGRNVLVEIYMCTFVSLYVCEFSFTVVWLRKGLRNKRSRFVIACRGYISFFCLFVYSSDKTDLFMLKDPSRIPPFRKGCVSLLSPPEKYVHVRFFCHRFDPCSSTISAPSKYHHGVERFGVNGHPRNKCSLSIGNYYIIFRWRIL